MIPDTIQDSVNVFQSYDKKARVHDRKNTRKANQIRLKGLVAMYKTLKRKRTKRHST